MSSTIVVYPHQLFPEHPGLRAAPSAPVVMVEDPVTFGHPTPGPRRREWIRLTMKLWGDQLATRTGRRVELLAADQFDGRASVVPRICATTGARHIVAVDPEDDWIERDLREGAATAGVALTLLPNPGFLLRATEARMAGSHRIMATFYREQRTARGILLDSRVETDAAPRPTGGRWSFDTENRKRIPRTLNPPSADDPHDGPDRSEIDAAAAALGIDRLPVAPVTRSHALRWFDRFLGERLAHFGPYEDAVDSRDRRWFHSLISPTLNSGLITPQEVVDRTMAHAARVGVAADDGSERGEAGVPIASLEGFVRQVLGWREYMRVTYRRHGREMRRGNALGNVRAMPKAFYTGTTGIVPFDRSVVDLHDAGWTHHIVRLMVQGNLMLLCDVHPDNVYNWFMELYIDAWDWVMVPNVYAMSQYADGGLITTKPYVSGSSYLRRMTDAPRGAWEEVWDGLYWRFIARHRERFAANPRMTMMIRQLDRMDGARRQRVVGRAERFLAETR